MTEPDAGFVFYPPPPASPPFVWCEAAAANCYELPFGAEADEATRCARCPGGTA